MTEKPWSVVNENDKARSRAKSIFRNLLQQNSTIRPSNNVPADIEVSIVDAMRAIKMLPVKKLKPLYTLFLITIPMNTTFQLKIGRQVLQESLQILTKSCPATVNGSTFWETLTTKVSS